MGKIRVGILKGQVWDSEITAHIVQVVDSQSSTDVWQSGGVSSFNNGGHVSIRDTTQVHSDTTAHMRTIDEDGNEGTLALYTHNLVAFPGQKIATFCLDGDPFLYVNLNTGDKYHKGVPDIWSKSCGKTKWNKIWPVLGFLGGFFLCAIPGRGSLEMCLLAGAACMFVFGFVARAKPRSSVPSRLNKQVKIVVDNYVNEWKTNDGNVKNLQPPTLSLW